MKLKRLSRKGLVLVLTMVLMVSLLIFGVVFMATVVYTHNNSKVQVDSAKAFYIAEAGLHKAIANVQGTATWRTTAYSASPSGCTIAAGTQSPCTENLGCGAYTIWAETTGSNIKITSKGTCNGIIRIVRQNIYLSGGSVAVVENTWTEV